MSTTTHRNPYVGQGEDGARRSARIDREELDTLSWSDPRYDDLLASAEAWAQQAYDLMLQRLGERPTLDQVRATVGSEEWLTALALLDVDPHHVVARDVARFTEWSRDGGTYTYEGEGDDKVSTFHPDALVDWQAWITDYDENGRGWSSTEQRLAQVVAAVVDHERGIPIAGLLDYMGSWEGEVWRILTEWGTGGNNRDLPGRYTVKRSGT